MFAWTDNSRKRLTKMHAAGNAPGIIAAALGTNPNAIRVESRRLELPHRKSGRKATGNVSASWVSLTIGVESKQVDRMPPKGKRAGWMLSAFQDKLDKEARQTVGDACGHCGLVAERPKPPPRGPGEWISISLQCPPEMLDKMPEKGKARTHWMREAFAEADAFVAEAA